MMILALILASTAPSAEAEQLGRQLAEVGTLSSILPMLRDKETAELLTEAKTLSPADQTQLKATASMIFERGRERLMTAEGHAYAERLSIEDLRALVAFHRSGAGQRARAAMPEVIAATMKAVGPIDFKGEVRAAMCEKMGKLCPVQ